MSKFLMPFVIILMILLPPIAGVYFVATSIKPVNNTVTTDVVDPVNPDVIVPPSVVIVPDVIKPVTYVQFGSYKSETIARKALQGLALLKSPLYNVLDLRVYKVTLTNGMWYRLALKAPDLASGTALCAKLKAAKQDCLVLTF